MKYSIAFLIIAIVMSVAILKLDNVPQYNIYQITTVMETDAETITSVYLKSSQSRQALDKYLERFTADEVVTDVAIVDEEIDELYTISIIAEDR